MRSTVRPLRSRTSRTRRSVAAMISSGSSRVTEMAPRRANMALLRYPSGLCLDRGQGWWRPHPRQHFHARKAVQLDDALLERDRRQAEIGQRQIAVVELAVEQ